MLGPIRIAGSRVAQIVADVWAAATRTLTAFTGQPRTDLVGSDTSLWLHTTRSLTGLDMEDVLDLPGMTSRYASILSVNSAAVADTFSAWTEIYADVGVGKRLLWAIVLVNGGDSIFAWEVEFSTAAAPGESRATGCEGSYQVATPGANAQYREQVRWLMFPLPNNARLSARVRVSVNSALNFKLLAVVE